MKFFLRACRSVERDGENSELWANATSSAAFCI